MGLTLQVVALLREGHQDLVRGGIEKSLELNAGGSRQILSLQLNYTIRDEVLRRSQNVKDDERLSFETGEKREALLSRVSDGDAV